LFFTIAAITRCALPSGTISTAGKNIQDIIAFTSIFAEGAFLLPFGKYLSTL
jgi:hypothetical protein